MNLIDDNQINRDEPPSDIKSPDKKDNALNDPEPKIDSEVNSPILSLKDKDSIVSEQIKIFRDKQAQAEKEKREKQKQTTSSTTPNSSTTPTSDENERLKYFIRETSIMRENRLREADRREKKYLREERDFREREKSWEGLEREKERERTKRESRLKEREKERAFYIKKEEESSEYWWKRFKDPRRRREKQHEKEEDERDRQQELLEIQQLEERDKIKQKSSEEENKAKLKQSTETINNSGSKLQLKNQPIKLGFAQTNQKRSRLVNDEDEEDKSNSDDNSQPKKKRVLVKLDYASEGIQTDEEKSRNPELNPELAKLIASKIPAAKEELFAYPINWELVEKVFFHFWEVEILLKLTPHRGISLRIK